MTQTREVGDVDYVVQSDTDETSSVVVTTSIYRSTADGEVPQLVCVVEDQGGGAVGETYVRSGKQVKVVTSVAGATAVTGITGV